MKAYKGFTKEMKCLDFQYEEGGEYEQSGEIKCCENGFHACEDPIDCFNYYSPAESVYHEVELDGNIVKEKDGSDTKVAASKIKIGTELNFFGIAKAHVEWIKKNIKKNKIKSNTGYQSAATNTGDWSAATNTGYQSAATNTGKRSAATNTGDQSAATVAGENSIAIAWGIKSKAKASLGSYIVLVEWEETEEGYVIKCAKMEKVDGEKIKADTFYMLKNGEIVEAEQ